MGKKQDRKEQQASNARSGAGSGDAAASEGLNKAAYLEQLAPMQLELNRVARWLQYTGKRLMVLIEGRDTAGKGGVIAAIADTLNPRQCRTVALPKPTERERTQWYFQRYVTHLPAAGEIALFDRCLLYTSRCV